MVEFLLSPFIQQEYFSVYAYAGVDAIRARLTNEGAAVVWNENDTFLGVLTPTDLAVRPSRLVMDCLRKKPVVRLTQSAREVLRTMLDSKETVLPVVYEHGELAGLVHQHTLVEYLLGETGEDPRKTPPLPRPLR